MNLQRFRKRGNGSSITQRAKLDECLRFVHDGDVLMVSKPDRLARNTAELLTIEQGLSARGRRGALPWPEAGDRRG